MTGLQGHTKLTRTSVHMWQRYILVEFNSGLYRKAQSRFELSAGNELQHFPQCHWLLTTACITDNCRFVLDSISKTRKLCYDRAVRHIYGCPENFRDSLTTPMVTFPQNFMGFCSNGTARKSVGEFLQALNIPLSAFMLFLQCCKCYPSE